jgi:ABC-type multidrug transport system ATPase subunit
MPTEGKLTYFHPNDNSVEIYYPLISIAAPYLDTIEEMTANEFFQFHSAFKPFVKGLPISEMLEKVGLYDVADKQIRYYSSGMKQRLKLAQAFFSDTPVVLLDEPTTHLDASGISIYHELIRNYCNERLVIISSNDPMEYSFCRTVIDMKNLQDYR